MNRLLLTLCLTLPITAYSQDEISTKKVDLIYSEYDEQDPAPLPVGLGDIKELEKQFGKEISEIRRVTETSYIIVYKDEVDYE